MNKGNTGLYIHMPFCVRKCNYCSFLSFAAEGSPRHEYSKALIREAELRGAGFDGQIDTIYIGGGTPSVMDISQLTAVMKAVRQNFDIAPDAEFTIEANPGTLGRIERVTRTKLTAYRYMGINRLSMGVQSMNNDRLHMMGRVHTAEDVIRDMRYAREAGFDNINLDLIFSVPGETRSDALDDAKKILELEPEHISCYSLQLEPGTPFYEMAESGELREVSDEEDRETYHAICRLLTDAGYEHYEISNFARTYRSKHNSKYWDMSDYIGLGLGASGFASGVRYRNLTDLTEYLQTFNADAAGERSWTKTSENQQSRIPVLESHANTPFDNISESVFTGLRRREGIRYAEALAAYERISCNEDGRACNEAEDTAASESGYLDRFWEIFGEARAEADRFAENGFLIIDGDGLRLTEKGIDISNRIMALFV